MEFRPRGRAAVPHAALRAFEAASRLGSFKAAAAELDVTPAAISHQVKSLEEHLGVSLFERLNRALRLLPAGAALGEAAQRAFRDLDRAIERARQTGTDRSALSVSVVPSLAAKWLVPRLHRFQDRHPDIELRLASTEAVVDLARDPGVDVALRYGAGPYPGLRAELLTWGHLTPVCSPVLLEGGSALRCPADLARHQLLRDGLPHEAGWLEWLTAAGVADRVKPGRGLRFSNSHLALDAAAAGRGVALVPELLIEEDLRAGRLVRPFALTVPSPSAYWFLARPDRAETIKVRRFLAWLRAELSAPPQ
ncbi:MAG TPA: transcriptional regulator GcvA [Aliidongia sp.]|uniref:transcriptional regulator GcvA n=1 Tax=Aliidongia sp. TaxID=1914230 RepID=UPI002DDD4AB1|nr:transcriptional regulator GcvA [Aliidongia sp.]HEV2676245.1 transcriptional regulator GcvA [Aliidongia sp.]